PASATASAKQALLPSLPMHATRPRAGMRKVAQASGSARSAVVSAEAGPPSVSTKFLARPGHTVLHPVYMRADNSRSPDRSTTLPPCRVSNRADAASAQIDERTAAGPPAAS